MTSGTGPRVVIIVQNLPVRRDRRVWGEACALADAGYDVSVICPRDRDPDAHPREGVRILAYPAAPEVEGQAGYLVETAWALLATGALLVGALVRRGIDVVQACNPPDVYVLLAAPLRALGIPFVFDQHDLSGELFTVRFGWSRGFVHGLLRLFERLSYAAADRVIVPNGSYRELGVSRWGIDPDRVTIVRNGPDDDAMRAGPAHPELKRGRDHLCCYLGMMGRQDGLDHLLRAIAHVVHDQRRGDCHFALLGDGEVREGLVALAHRLDVDDFVTFTGYADDATIRRYLSTADVGVSPEPRDPFNEVSTMIKVAEYLAFGLPVVAYDLRETRRTAGDAGAYAADDDPASLAATLTALLDDPQRRATMGRHGRRRVEESLAWRHQVGAYVGVFDGLCGRDRSTTTE